MTEKNTFVLGRVENIMGNGENAGYQYFLLIPLCFQKAFYTVVLMWLQVKQILNSLPNDKILD